jgi:hypothetical protein
MAGGLAETGRIAAAIFPDQRRRRVIFVDNHLQIITSPVRGEISRDIARWV